MTHLLTNVVSFAFALGVIIFVHESGHLLVAKAFGVKVLTFSLGFGKSLWSVTRGETEYRISALPLGGYVRLSGENAEETTGDPRDFQSKPRWQRILVYLAGPAMNVVLAITLFAVLFMVGIAVPNIIAIPAVVGTVEPGSSAAAAGIVRGDRILSVKGKPVANWEDLGFELLASPDRPVPLVLERAGKTFKAVVTPRRIEGEEVGDGAGLFPSIFPQITQVTPGSPAEAAGFATADEIRAVDGRPISGGDDFVRAIQERGGKPLAVQVLREGVLHTLTVVPRHDPDKWVIGVGIGLYQRYSPGKAIVQSLRYNVEIVVRTFQMIGKIFTRDISAKSALSGPIGIATQTGEAARHSFKELLYLMGFLSISIAILNLMPIPILDGGQIFILSIEGVIRRDLSLRFKEVITQVGFVMILLLMLVVIWFDFSKLLPKGLLPGS
ncbi:MAG TPA: RIP metalloprotease RseP [Thermoanaerobaculia bacterium]|nr:RIP metalloprotease RseP [Thermoanaerobaculia bacterium]